jgi:hypothetical protein
MEGGQAKNYHVEAQKTAGRGINVFFVANNACAPEVGAHAVWSAAVAG